MILLLLLFTVVYADVSHQSNGTNIQVLGQSGKARITRGEQVVTMRVDYLSEVDNFDNEVGNIGQDKHSVNSFATQSFTFSPLLDKEYQNVSVKEFTFETPIYNVGKMKLVTMLVGQSSSMGTETESWQVSPGDMKWNIELSDWTFCNPCADGTASFIDVGIEIKGTKNDTGVGPLLQLSKRVVIDGTEQNMPESYPKVITIGTKQLFVFRFPKFTNSAIYDPVLQMSTAEVTSNSYAITPLLTLTCLIGIVMVVLL